MEPCWVSGEWLHKGLHAEGRWLSGAVPHLCVWHQDSWKQPMCTHTQAYILFVPSAYLHVIACLSFAWCSPKALLAESQETSVYARAPLLPHCWGFLGTAQLNDSRTLTTGKSWSWKPGHRLFSPLLFYCVWNHRQGQSPALVSPCVELPEWNLPETLHPSLSRLGMKIISTMSLAISGREEAVLTLSNLITPFPEERGVESF